MNKGCEETEDLRRHRRSTLSSRFPLLDLPGSTQTGLTAFTLPWTTHDPEVTARAVPCGGIPVRRSNHALPTGGRSGTSNHKVGRGRRKLNRLIWTKGKLTFHRDSQVVHLPRPVPGRSRECKLHPEETPTLIPTF